ncbi:unnamed protein product [Closterium sp. NIES-64]|nr:unnamed protein product [Closterium sp. NIES-64]
MCHACVDRACAPRGRNQMERLYDAMRRQEGEWKAKAEDERQRLAEVMDACSKVRQQLAAEQQVSQQQEQQIRSLQEELRAARGVPHDNTSKKPPEGGNP